MDPTRYPRARTSHHRTGYRGITLLRVVGPGRRQGRHPRTRRTRNDPQTSSTTCRCRTRTTRLETPVTTRKPMPRDQARQIAQGLLRQGRGNPEIAYWVAHELAQAKLAGPWEPHPNRNIIARPVPVSGRGTQAFAAVVNHAGSWFEWTTEGDQGDDLGDHMPSQALGRLPGGSRTTGKAGTLVDALKAADHRLRHNNWTLIGQAQVGSQWSKPQHDLITHEIVPCITVRKDEGSPSYEPIAEVNYGFFDRGEAGGEIEGCEVIISDHRSPAHLGIVERRPQEPLTELFLRAWNLADGQLRQHHWLLTPPERPTK